MMQMETSIIETSFSDGEDKPQDEGVRFAERELTVVMEKHPRSRCA
jgi:hypothetical protein